MKSVSTTPEAPLKAVAVAAQHSETYRQYSWLQQFQHSPETAVGCVRPTWAVQHVLAWVDDAAWKHAGYTALHASRLHSNTTNAANTDVRDAPSIFEVPHAPAQTAGTGWAACAGALAQWNAPAAQVRRVGKALRETQQAAQDWAQSLQGVTEGAGDAAPAASKKQWKGTPQQWAALCSQAASSVKAPLHRRVVAMPLAVHGSPALAVTFAEVLQNAMDRVHGDALFKDLWVKVQLTGAGALLCSVHNSGMGMPVRRLTAVEQSGGGDDCPPSVAPEGTPAAAPWLPTAVFSSLNFGSNYGAQRCVWAGGRNGKGAKLTNATSTAFRVRCVDGASGAVFTQEWRHRAVQQGEPAVTLGRPPFAAAGGGLRSSATPGAAAPRKDSGVTVQWRPDPEFFGVHAFSAESAAVLRCQAWAAAAWLHPWGVRVHLDGRDLPSLPWGKFAAAWCGATKVPCVDTVPLHSRLQGEGGREGACPALRVAVVPVAHTPAAKGAVHAWVNGLWVPGGTHVDVVLEALCKALSPRVGVALKPGALRDLLHIVVAARVPLPRFNSNTKTTLDVQQQRLGWTWTPSAAMLHKLEGPVKAAAAAAAAASAAAAAVLHANRALAASAATAGGALVGGSTGGATARVRTGAAARANRAALDTDKYTAADGVVRGCSATLLVCEGDSAASMAYEGRAVMGSSAASVLVLRGKPLNVQGSTLAACARNAEVCQLATALGLSFGQQVQSRSELCHARVLVMADQDDDGGHIGALVYNALAHLWPSLMAAAPDFVQVLRTPLHRVLLKGTPAPLEFFDDAAYEAWARGSGGDARVVSHARYKGLGSHTPAQQRGVFRDLSRYVVTLTFAQPCTAEEAGSGAGGAPHDSAPQARVSIDSASTAGALALHFSKSAAAQRAAALAGVEAGSTAGHPQQGGHTALQEGGCTAGALENSDGALHMPATQWLHAAMLQYGAAANTRQIPHVLDGLKQVQRQVLWTAFGASGAAPAVPWVGGAGDKVPSLAGRVAQHAKYMHGPVSVEDAVRTMVKWHPGKAHLPLLRAAGASGNRVVNKPPAARYMAVGLPRGTRALFHPRDDAVLPRARVDGCAVQVEAYVPVVPHLLLAPVRGVGWGSSCASEPLPPPVVLEACKAAALGNDDAACAAVETCAPWWDGWVGTVHPEARCGAWLQRGVYMVHPPTPEGTRVVTVWELPTAWSVTAYLAALQKDCIMSDAAVEAADDAAAGQHPCMRTLVAAQAAAAAAPDCAAAAASLKAAEARVQALRKRCVLSFKNLSASNAVHVDITLHEWAAKPLLESSPRVLPPHDVQHVEYNSVNAMQRRGLDAVRAAGGMPVHPLLERVLRLRVVLHQRYVAWDATGGSVRSFAHPGDVLKEFLPVRRAVYTQRLAAVAHALQQQAVVAQGKALFLRAVANGAVTLQGHTNSAALHAALSRQGVPEDPRPSRPAYAYVTSLSVAAVCEDAVCAAEDAARRAATAAQAAALDTVQKAWLRDLQALEAQWLLDAASKRADMSSEGELEGGGGGKLAPSGTVCAGKRSREPCARKKSTGARGTRKKARGSGSAGTARRGAGVKGRGGDVGGTGSVPRVTQQR